jgi:hypothetical protein
MQNDYWKDESNILFARHSYLNLNADIASPNLVEFWGVYCYLPRLAES